MNPMLTELSNLFEEDLVPGIEDRLATVDPAYARIVSSQESVVQDEITKDYKVLHTFCRSLSGAVRYGSPLGPQMVENTGATEIIHAHDGYPGVSEIPLPGIQRRYITLGKIRGNTTMALAQVRANQLHTVGDYPALTLQQTAKMCAHTAAVSWYLDDNADVARLDLTGTGATVTVSGNVVTLVGPTATGILLTGRKRRLQPGLQYDVWTTNQATCYTTNGYAMITADIDLYDFAGLTLYFQSAADALAFYVAQGNDGGGDFDVMLTPFSSHASKVTDGTGLSIVPCGYQWWMRATGTLYGTFGDLNVATYGSMFKSKVAALSANLTEQVMEQYISSFEEATGVDLDTILTTNGVINDLLNSYGTSGSSLIRAPQPVGEAGAKIGLGWSSLKYVHNGKEYDILPSYYLNAGETLVLKSKGGNLIRYRPPKVPGTEGGPAMFDPGIEWLGKLFYDSIWMPSTAAGGGKTDGMEAPFDLLTQHAAKEMRGIRLTDVTEINV